MVDIAVPWNGVPTIYKNVAILGATTGEVALAEPGDTRAFDVRTGKQAVGLPHGAAARRARTQHLAGQRLARIARA